MKKILFLHRFARIFLQSYLYLVCTNWEILVLSIKRDVGMYFLVWPQWWSWADVSQQGVDFSKKISKIRIIFWFDFHRCSHGPSKIRRHFRNKSRSILKLSKNVFYKKCGPKLIFFNEKKIQKDSNDFWHRKLTLKVRFRHFLMTPVNIRASQIKKLFLFYWFFC